MRKFIFTTTFFVISPFAFLFALIISLVLIHQNALTKAPLTAKSNIVYAALPIEDKSFSAEISENDGRSEKVRQFMARYGSPLEPYAQDIVDAADEYGLDYRLVPAIAMQESNLCRVIPINSYNCWGFGVYGKTVMRFSSYKEAIYTITKTLATNYKENGLVTPEQIMTMYTPSSNGSWAFSVNHFMDLLR